MCAFMPRAVMGGKGFFLSRAVMGGKGCFFLWRAPEGSTDSASGLKRLTDAGAA